MSVTKIPLFRTSDFSIACYIRMRGVTLKKFEKIPNSRNQHVFFFEDNFEINGKHIFCSDLEISYINSESYMFDSAQRALKKLCINNRDRDNFPR